jgi:hypothetical protein
VYITIDSIDLEGMFKQTVVGRIWSLQEAQRRVVAKDDAQDR